MNTIIVKTNDATQTVAQVQVVTKDGKPTIIKAMDKVNYEFHDAAIGRAPNHIITKRLKNDLHISFEEDGKESDLIIEGFYDEADSALLGIAEDGEYYYYIPDTGETYDYVTQLETGDIEGQALGGTEYIAAAIPWWIPAAAGLGLAGLVVGLSSGGGDDDKPIEPAPIVSLNGVTSLSEANAANEANTAVYTVSLDRASATDTTVTVTITPGSADGGDYSAPITQTVTIPAGQTSIDFSVPIVNDDVYEGVESFTVAITSVTAGRANINSSKDTVDTVIYDNDPATGSDIPVVKIIATDEQAIEGVDNGLVFTISQNQISNFDTLVDVKLSDTSSIEVADITSISYVGIDGVTVFLSNANDIQDFLTNGASVKIPAGQSSAPAINVTVANDTIYEQSESIVLDVVINTNSPTPATISINSATGTILDESDDPQNPAANTDGDKPTLTVGNASATEGDNLVHQVTVNGITQADVTYDFALTNGPTNPAIAGSDFTNAPTFSNEVIDNGDGTITVPAGVTGFTVSYPTSNDTILENNETTELTIDGVAGTGTIKDALDAIPVVSIKTADGADTAIEGVADDTIVFEIFQTGATDKDSTVTVKLDLPGGIGGAVAADILDQEIIFTDAKGLETTYTVAEALAGIEVTIPAVGATNNPTFTITPANDGFYEVSEVLGMSITGAVNATVNTDPTLNSATGTILDESDDPQNPAANTDGDKPTLTVGNASATEGDNLVHQVTVNGITQADVTYDFALTNGPTNPAIAGSDFTNAPTFSNEVIDNGDGTITVPAGVTGFTVSYPTSNDTILENNETTELTIDGVAGTGTIKDALDAIPVVSIKTADGADTAIEGVADDTIVFEIFQTGATDKDSTVTVKLDLPGGIGGAVAADILDQEVIFTDAKGLETTYTVAEALAGIEVTIPAVGATNNPTFTITPANDGFYEVSEVLGMSITGAVNATVNTDPTLNSATGTILDESDDPQNPAANTDGDKPTLTVGNASATEGDNLVHQVTVNGTTQADVTYDFALTNGPTNPAIAGSDFTNAPTFSNEVIDNGDGTITVPAGVTGFTVSYPTSNDTILENNETTELTIDGVAGTGTIKDALDAIPVVSIKTADGADTAIEGVADDTIVFEIFQTGATDKDSTVTVKLDLPGGIGGAVAADILDQEIIFTDAKGLETTYTVAEALAGIEVTIPAVGATNNPTFTITPANDGFYEVSEVLGMSITGAVNATVNTDPTLNSATGTILDESDDPQNPAANTDGDKPTLTVGNASATEGDNLVHQVTVNGTTQADVTYDFALTNGPTNPAIAGSDFTNAPTFSNEVIDNGDGTITVPAGVTGFTVSYPTSNDTILENNETTELTIDGVAGTGTIKDALDAIPVVSIKTADGADTAIEGVADDTIVFEIFQTGATDKDSTVTVKLDLPGGIGGAVAADILDQEVIFTDAKGLETTYTVAEALAGIEVTIPAVGATNNPTFTITPANDGFYEVSEVLGMSITGAVNATVNTDPTLNSATGTILDESDDPQNPAANTDGDKPTLTVGNASATEGDNLVHQVTVNGTTQADVTYDFALTNGPTNPAIAGSDFTNAPTFSNEVIDNGDGTITVPAGVTGFTVSYPTSNDTILENNETTELTIDGVAGTGTIKDALDAIPVVSIKTADGADTAIEGVADDTIVFEIFQTGATDKDSTVTVKLDLPGGIGGAVAADILDQEVIFTDAKGLETTYTVAEALAGIEVTIPAVGATNNPTFTITPANDGFYEVSEVLGMSITGAVNATVNTDPTLNSATGTILDESDDPQNPAANTDGDKPTLTVGNASATEGDNLVHQVTVNGTTQADVTYDFALTNGSATAGDYSSDPADVIFSDGVINNGDGTITVPAGVTSFTVSYPTSNDTILENNETTKLTIDGVAGTGTILDNDIVPMLTINDNRVTEATGDTVIGIFTVTNPQSVASLDINDQDVTLATPSNPIVISGGSAGSLSITNYDSQTGILTYEYTEDGNAKDHNVLNREVFEQFNVVLTNTIGGTINDTLDIEIIDTVPVANNDKNSVTENVNVDEQSNKIIATGNVISGAAPTEADDLGADATIVTAVESSGGDVGIADGITPTLGNFGELTLSRDGDYTYSVDNAAIEFLAVGEQRKETFEYTITDADGSTDTAKLTITIIGTNDQPTIKTSSNGLIASTQFIEPTDDTTLTQNGIISFNDKDTTDGLTISYLEDANTTITTSSGLNFTEDQEAVLRGLFEIDPATVTDTTADWDFEARADYIDFIPAGTTVTIRYAVQVNDDKGVTTAVNGNELSKSEIRYVEVTITGTNDGGIALADNSITINENGTTTSGGVLATIFDENDTDDPDFGEQLTVESFQIGNGSAITVDPDNLNNLSQNVNVGTNKVGEITFNSDGTYEYVATSDYSGTLPVITANVSNGVTGATREETSQKLTITVNPVSDAPQLTNVSVTTEEDTEVTLGLKAPVITDATDLNSSSPDDTPERIGLVTLTGVPNGTVLDYGVGTITATGAPITIQLDGNGVINNSGPATASMTVDQFEAIKLTPPKDDASNISITMSVTSFEVDSSGNRVNVDGTGAVVTTGGSPITGKTSTSTISIDVTAVTDTVLNNAAGDDASSFGVDSSYVIEPNDGISSIIGNDVIAEVEENKSVDIPITTTFGDLAGSAANGSRETYGFVITGLKPGTVVEFIDASGNVIATSGTVDANGTTTIGANANKDGSGNIILDSNTGLATVTGTNEPVFNTSTGQPIIRIKPDQYNSLDMNDIEVSLYTQDHDSDSDLDPNLAGIQKDASVELIDTINVNLTVTPVAGQVGLDNQGVQTKEDTPVTLDTFGFTVLDKPDGASTEVIDSIVFDIPVGWSYVDGVDSANNVTNAAVVTTITIDMTSSPDLSTFSIKPPAQSSTDTEFSFTVTTTDTDDDGGNTVTSTSESPLTQTVVVTPVAEVVGGRSDNDTIDDLTINPDRVYTATAQEDAAFNLGSGIDANTSTTFNLIDGWSNQDDMVDFGQESHTAAANDSEQTYAHLTFGSRDNGEFTAIAGAVFTYSVDGGATTEPALTDNGTGVDIPAAYLNTVTVTPPQDYSDYTVTSESATAQTAVKVEAKTIDYDEDGGASVTATSGGSYLTFTVTGVADPATLAVDPAEGIEDQAIIGGNTRATAADMGDVTTGTIGSDITPINGIALNIRPSSRDSLSETYDVTISEIPLDGQLYQNNKGVITLLDTSSGSVIIPNYTNDVTNLYFVPAENYSGTVTLKVSAVSQEEGTTGTQSTTLNLPIKVIGKADLILNDDLAVDLENVNYTKVIAEDQPNSEGLSTNSIAVSDFFDDAMSIAPYDSGSPQPEAISYSITGLPEGFNIIGAGVVFLGGSGADRVWSVPLAAIQNGGAMLTTPEHFAGDISFDIQDTTTERVSGNSVTHSPKTVSVLIVPDAADGTVNNPQVVAFEDEWTTIDFNAAFKTTDASAGDEVLDTITLNPDDIANVVLLVNGEAPEVGNYTFNASDKIEVKYNSANEHSDAPFNIRFDYTYTDTATLTDGTKLITTSSSQTDNEVNVTFQAVTDDPTIALAETDVSIDNSGFNDTATVTVSLTSADQDGSEIFTRLEVSGVPDGIIVQGGIVSNGVWYVDVPNPAITTGIAPSYDLVLERDNGADFSINNINTITVTGVTQDIAGKGIDGREEVDSKDFILELTRTNPGNNPPPADLVNNLVIKPIEPNEDSSFNLGDVIDATLVGTSASSVTAYNIALSGVPEGTNLSVDPEASGQVSAIRIGDQWIISVNDASTLTPQKALNAISVSLPEDFSTNETGQELSFNATFTARDNKGREDVSPTENIAITVKPVTDTFDNHNGISPVVAAEDARVDIDINLTNSADGDYVSLINGKLYIEIDESNLKRGNGDAGILEYNGTRLNSTEVTASELAGTGIAPGEYYVVDVADSNGAIDGVNPPSSVKVQYTPAADANGSAIIFVNAAHKEVSDVAIDGDIETYKHQYTVDVTAQPDKLNVFKPDTEDTTVTAVGNEDTLIPIPYEISSRDTQGDNDGSVNGKFDKATGISIDNVPDGYLVYYIDSNDIQQLANNNGNKNSNGNLWTINATDLSSEADSIFIQPPENISAEVTGVEMRVISDSGLVSEPLNITLQVKPVADGLTFNPTDTIGNQGKWTALNLNAVLEDTDSSETVNIVITDNGVNLTDDVLRFRVNSNKELLTAIWDEATNSYTIIGITLKQINDLQINSSVPLEADLEFALSTTDTVTYTEGTVTDTSDVYIDIDGNVPSVSVDIAFSKTFVGTEENDIVDASGQSVSVNYKGGAGDDIFIGGSGNDFLDGGTGANTLRGGAGNDTLVFAADNLLMDGGAGIDTLLINMANTTIDFGTFDLSKFESIEVIDMTGNGAQSLTNLSTIDVLDIISDTAMINKDLIIKGDGGINGDSVTLTDEWISSGTRSQGGTSYNVYSFSDTNGTHDLLIQTDVNTTIL